MLGVAAIAALYGFVRMFDVKRPGLAETIEPPQRIDFEPGVRPKPIPVAEEHLPILPLEVAEIAETAPTRGGAGRRSGSRKGGGRRAKPTKAAIAAEPALVKEAEVPWPVAEEATLSATEPEDEIAVAAGDDAAHPHIAPLFEPDPFVRMPRQAFGRRGQI